MVLKALLVDDEPDLRRITRIALERIGGLSVTEAASGRAALAIIEEDRPDVIVLDIMMPLGDGTEVLEELAGDPRRASIPVVAITARALPDELDRLKRLGAVAVVAKPFDPIWLAREVARIARERAPAARAETPRPGGRHERGSA
jgi:CheY-like chemotaxis protein